MKNHAFLACLAIFLSSSIVNGDGITTAYWDFTTSAAVVGGISTSDVGNPTLGVDGIYGSAPGSGGNSLNTVLGGTGAGGGFLEGDVFPGLSPIHFGTGDFSFSYWSFNDSFDGDGRGARIFDTLSGTTSGMQLGTDINGIFNFRMDDLDGNSIISNTSGGLGGLRQDDDNWIHVSVTIDRANDLASIYFDGGIPATMDISSLTGNLDPTLDLQMGVINGGSVVGQAQRSGLDDFAFYSGVLSASQIADLAAGNTNPGNYVLPVPEPSGLELIGLVGLVGLLRRSKH
jgi:hypothetical protein